MVHVKKCPLGKRSTPTTEFYIAGEPQIYCMGYEDCRTDEPLEECRKCLDWVCGEQMSIDFMNMQKSNKTESNRRESSKRI